MLFLLNRSLKYLVVTMLSLCMMSISYAETDRADDISILDIDADGDVDALTDGLLLLRSMFGLTDDALATGVVDLANCTECDAAGIDSYISTIKGATYGGLTSGTGPAGPQGEKGDTGPAGADGSDGAAGADGSDGAIGPQGATGAAGATGATGATGSSGGTGSIGELSDVLMEDNSIYIGNIPSATTDAAQYNVGLGATALESITTGYNNMAIGHDALSDNTEGYWNTASGNFALGLNTTGFRNTASGYAALYLNITGERNTATGTLALYSNTAGTDNTATGSVALYENTTGYGNAATGAGALYYNDTGIYNTATGVNALLANITGTYNTAIGYAADVASEDLTNATAIGSGASVSESNKIRLGDSNVVVIEGQVAFSASSDRRLKKDITNTKYGLQTILKLVPVDYKLKLNDLSQVGFIAQDLRPLVPEAVTGFEGDLDKGETMGVTYTTLIPVLTKAIQEQQALIKQLQKDMEILKQKVAKG
jgi:hypothetical protein